MEPAAAAAASAKIIEAGTLGALLVFVVAVSSLIIGVLYRSTRESDKSKETMRDKCEGDIRRVWEERLAEQERVLVALEKNASSMAENSRVLESRATALRALEAAVSRQTATYEGNNAALRDQVRRVEGLMLTWAGGRLPHNSQPFFEDK